MTLLQHLTELGASATSEQLGEALAACFPQGTDGCDEAVVVKTLLRHLRRSQAGRSGP